MPNIAGVLKEEIRRLAKREIKAQVGTTQKAATQYRRDIAKLKRLLGQQEREIKHIKKSNSNRANPSPLKTNWKAFAFRPARSRLNDNDSGYRLRTMANWSAYRV